MKEAAIMKEVAWVFALALVLVVGAAGSGFAGEEDRGRVTAQEVKKQVERALDSAKAYTDQQRKDYQQKIEAKLEDLKKNTSELRKSADTVKGEALAKVAAGIADLKQKQADAEQKLKELQSASTQAWGDVKSGLDKAMVELKKSYDKALSYFK
jgi:chromosome segregation ATPase